MRLIDPRHAMGRPASLRIIQRQWTISEQEMPKTAQEWVAKLQELNVKNTTAHTFAHKGDLILINSQYNLDGYSGLTIHFEKLAELTRGGDLEKLVTGSTRKPAPNDELVKTEGLRLRFDNNLMQAVDDFMTTNVPSTHHLKVRGFLVSSMTPQQDRARLFDLVNDNVQADVKQKAATYAAEHGTDARLFANHYTFFVAHSPDGKIPPTDVHSAFETKRLKAKSLKFGPLSLKPATTADDAESTVRSASAELTFESFEAAASHLEKHPLQNQKTDRLNRYVEWARLAIAKGDTKKKTKRSQFDAGWEVPFDYFGQTLMVRLRGDGQAFITTFSPQTSSFKLSDAAPYMEGVPTVYGQTRLTQAALKQPIEKVRTFVKDRLSANKTVTKQENKQPTVFDPSFIPGALYTCPNLTVILQAKLADDGVTQNGPTEFALVLNGTLTEGLAERTDFVLDLLRRRIHAQSMDAGERFERAQTLLDTATQLQVGPGKTEAAISFASFANTQLGIDPSAKNPLLDYENFVTNQLATLSVQIGQCQIELAKSLQPTDPLAVTEANEVERLRQEFNTLRSAVSTATDKKAAGLASKKAVLNLEAAEEKYRKLIGVDAAEKLNAHQERAQRIINLFSVLQARLVKQNYEHQRILPPRAQVTGELIYHLITPWRASRGDFEGVGISGGHLESALRQFLTVFPEYHFVQIKQATALGTTLRLYRQFMWKDEHTAPPLLTDVAHRPTADAPLPNLWLEAKVCKSTAENLVGWLNQGREAFAAWTEFDPEGPASQRFGRGLYEGAQGERAHSTEGVEFGGRVELSKELQAFVVTQLVPHVEWLKSLV